MLNVHHIEKHFGQVPALTDVSFSIESGQIVGLLGPNGAGKTTTIKILTGYLQPDAGNVEIDGLDVLTHPRLVQARIGYLPESAPLYGELSVQRYLHMMAELRQIPEPLQREYISQAVYATNLEHHLTRPISQLSKGFRQRVGLAQAILHRPKLLILDEPTIGLDPTQLVDIRRLIRQLAQHTTILFSTHILSEVEALCDRVIMLLNGQVRADARLDELSSPGTATLVLQRPVPDAAETLAEVDGVTHVRKVGGDGAFDEPHHFTIQVMGGTNIDLCPLIYAVARRHDWPVRELRQDTQTLESVFNRLVIESPPVPVAGSRAPTPGPTDQPAQHVKAEDDR